MKKFISFVLALYMVAGIYAQTQAQYDELIQVYGNVLQEFNEIAEAIY